MQTAHLPATKGFGRSPGRAAFAARWACVRPSAGLDSTPQLVDPRGRLPPGLSSCLPSLMPVEACLRIRAEELDAAVFGGEVAKRVGDQFVAHVPCKVDHEAVTAEPGLRRSRLESRQVDRPCRELLENPQQRSRAVLALEAHDRGLVVAGRRGDAGCRARRIGSRCRGDPRSPPR